MPDRRFRDSVLMLTHHDHTGAHGLVMNKPTDFTLADILDSTPITWPENLRIPVYWGGPVSPNSLWMLHSTDWVCEHTAMITSAWAMTSSQEMFHHLADLDCPRYFRMLIGYAAWAPNQLERELEGQGPWDRDHAWLTAQNLGPEWLLEQPVEELWSNVVTLSGHQAVDSWL